MQNLNVVTVFMCIIKITATAWGRKYGWKRSKVSLSICTLCLGVCAFSEVGRFICVWVFVPRRAAVFVGEGLCLCTSVCVCECVFLHAVITKHKQQHASPLLPLAVTKTECVCRPEWRRSPAANYSSHRKKGRADGKTSASCANESELQRKGTLLMNEGQRLLFWWYSRSRQWRFDSGLKGGNNYRTAKRRSRKTNLTWT